MNYNSEKLKQYCRTKGYNIGEVKLISFALLQEDSEVMDVLLNSLNGKQFELLRRISIGDYEEDGYTLKPNILKMLQDSDKSKYDEFIDKLSVKGLKTNGIEGNLKPYSVFYDNKETKAAFQDLDSKIKDLNIDRLVEVTINYYTNVEYCVKIEKYLSAMAKQEYLSYNSFKVKEKIG